MIQGQPAEEAVEVRSESREQRALLTAIHSALAPVGGGARVANWWEAPDCAMPDFLPPLPPQQPVFNSYARAQNSMMMATQTEYAPDYTVHPVLAHGSLSITPCQRQHRVHSPSTRYCAHIVGAPCNIACRKRWSYRP
jgi:hypothetical protein